jgi:hypothetical protein
MGRAGANAEEGHRERRQGFTLGFCGGALAWMA